MQKSFCEVNEMADQKCLKCRKTLALKPFLYNSCNDYRW